MTTTSDQARISTLRGQAREAFRQFVWPVTVLTYRHGSDVLGVTMSSVTSLSLDPPSLVFCIHRESRTAEHVRVGRRFALSLLAPSHVELAQRLAVPGGDKRLADAELAAEDGTDPPSPAGSISSLAVEAISLMPAYSHLVVVALVRQVSPTRRGGTLAYHDGSFHAPVLAVVEHGRDVL